MSADISVRKLIQQMNKSYKEAEKEIGHCNILVIGKTGVGKSTLVNSIFQTPLAKSGSGSPVTKSIHCYRKRKCPLTIYDTPGLELNPQQIEQVRSEVSQLIADCRKYEDVEKHIHVIWYCINHESKRIDPIEEQWIKELARKDDVPVILVLTQTLEKKETEFQVSLKKKNLPVRQIIPVLAETKIINDSVTIKAYGLDRLVKVTLEILPEVAKKPFVAEQIGDINLKGGEAFKYLTAYVASSSLVGASPIPFSDAPILLTIQTTMLAHISRIFGLDLDRDFIFAVFSGVGGATGMSTTGKFVVSNLLKLIPGAGTAAGSAISGATSATLTFALGLAYIEALKIYTKSKIEGHAIPLSELSKIILEQYKFYITTGQRELKSSE